MAYWWDVLDSQESDRGGLQSTVKGREKVAFLSVCVK